MCRTSLIYSEQPVLFIAVKPTRMTRLTITATSSNLDLGQPGGRGAFGFRSLHNQKHINNVCHVTNSGHGLDIFCRKYSTSQWLHTAASVATFQLKWHPVRSCRTCLSLQKLPCFVEDWLSACSTRRACSAWLYM